MNHRIVPRVTAVVVAACQQHQIADFEPTTIRLAA